VFHYFEGETVNCYLGDCHNGETTNLNLYTPIYLSKYSKGLGKPEQTPDSFTKNITSILFDGMLEKHEYSNKDFCFSIPSLTLERSPTSYSLFDSKQAIISQLMSRMSYIGKNRDGTKKENLYRIESDILKCHNQLLEIGGFYVGQNKSVDQRRLSIEQRLFDLYREKRAEEASCWKDQLWLQRDIIAYLKEYLDIQRRKKLINEIMEGEYSTNQNHD
jgi:hypothetical protein